MVDDFEHPPLILVGCDDADTADQLRELYAAVDAPFVHTPINTAEMVKYACNAFHALKVCFANEIAGLCDGLSVDAQEVMAIVRQDRKLNIAPSYLKPGFAFGGSCLPKDLRALLSRRAPGRRVDSDAGRRGDLERVAYSSRYQTRIPEARGRAASVSSGWRSNRRLMICVKARWWRSSKH